MVKSWILLLILSLLGSNYAWITGCQSYNQTDGVEICEKCQPNYFLGSKKLTCNQCPLGCSECTAQGMCSACQDGYYFFKGSCKTCIQGCRKCDKERCLECIPGNTLINDHTCLKCISNCKVCDSTESCTSCIDGFRINIDNLGKDHCTLNKAMKTEEVIGLLLVGCCLLICFSCCYCAYRQVFGHLEYSVNYEGSSQLKQSWGGKDVKSWVFNDTSKRKKAAIPKLTPVIRQNDVSRGDDSIMLSKVSNSASSFLN